MNRHTYFSLLKFLGETFKDSKIKSSMAIEPMKSIIKLFCIIYNKQQELLGLIRHELGSYSYSDTKTSGLPLFYIRMHNNKPVVCVHKFLTLPEIPLNIQNFLTIILDIIYNNKDIEKRYNVFCQGRIAANLAVNDWKFARQFNTISVHKFLILFCNANNFNMGEKNLTTIVNTIEQNYLPLDYKECNSLEDYRFMYSNSGPDSCMKQGSGRPWNLTKPLTHPAEFYHYCPFTTGAFIFRGNQVAARTILYTLQDGRIYYGRIYPASGEIHNKFINILKGKGYSALAHDSSNRCPYITREMISDSLKEFSIPIKDVTELNNNVPIGYNIMFYPYFDNFQHTFYYKVNLDKRKVDFAFGTPKAGYLALSLTHQAGYSVISEKKKVCVICNQSYDTFANPLAPVKDIQGNLYAHIACAIESTSSFSDNSYGYYPILNSDPQIRYISRTILKESFHPNSLIYLENGLIVGCIADMSAHRRFNLVNKCKLLPNNSYLSGQINQIIINPQYLTNPENTNFRDYLNISRQVYKLDNPQLDEFLKYFMKSYTLQFSSFKYFLDCIENVFKEYPELQKPLLEYSISAENLVVHLDRIQ